MEDYTHEERSAPAYQSPARHHKRAPSRSKAVKETLNARSHYGSSEDDGGSIHRINQYNIKQEIGRGSFGAVHLAVDQYGNEYVSKGHTSSSYLAALSCFQRISMASCKVRILIN